MNRVIGAAMLVLTLAACAAAGAAGPIRLVGPRAAVAEEPWQARVTGGTAAVVATLGAREVRARSLGGGRVRAVFPVPGRWRLHATAKGKRTALGPVTVAQARPAFEGARSVQVCTPGDVGVPYPQLGLSTGAGGVWAACRNEGRVVRLDEATLARRSSVAMPAGFFPFSLSAGEGGAWVVSRDSLRLVRVDPASGRAAEAAVLPDASAYLWAGAGAVWVAIDSPRTVVRLDPGSHEARATIPTDDGTSAFASDGRTVWIVNHRVGSIQRIDVGTNAIRTIASGLGDERATFERMILFAGSLWVTGRGLDLIRLDPDTGRIQATIEIGPAGVDLAAAGGSVWVTSATDAAAERGLPTVAALHRVDPATNAVVETLRARRPFQQIGIAVAGSRLLLFDGTRGRVVAVDTG